MFFFFSSPGDPRHLHSFPTRRSSDLDPSIHLLLALAHQQLGQREAALQSLRRAIEIGKSTRLNSSHVSISYAVFCLKKKKKINLHNNNDTSITITKSNTLQSRTTTKH